MIFKKCAIFLSMLLLIGTPAFTCSATANCTCGGDKTLSFDDNQWDSCSCSKVDGEHGYVQCSGSRAIVDPINGAHGTETKDLRLDCDDCPPADDNPGGSNGSSEGGDLSWCSECYDANGQLTPLGEFFILANS